MSTLLFLGDSITDAGRLTDPEGLGQGYVRLIADATDGGTSGRVVNRGVSGDRIDDLRRRWDADVASAAPETLTVFVGINHTWRRFDSDDPTPPDVFERGYRDLLQAAGRITTLRELVLVEPFLVPVDPAQQDWLDDLAGKRDVISRLAIEFEAALLPLHRVLTAAAQSHGAAAIASDGVHPTPFGHRLIADARLAIRNGEADSTYLIR